MEIIQTDNDYHLDNAIKWEAVPKTHIQQKTNRFDKKL